jgi:Arc/MetJ family transcription regulator
VVNTYPVSAVKRTSLNLDLDLVAEARAILGTHGTTDTVNRALAEIVHREKLRALAAETFEDLTPEALAELRRTRTWE